MFNDGDIVIHSATYDPTCSIEFLLGLGGFQSEIDEDVKLLSPIKTINMGAGAPKHNTLLGSCRNWRMELLFFAHLTSLICIVPLNKCKSFGIMKSIPEMLLSLIYKVLSIISKFGISVFV